MFPLPVGTRGSGGQARGGGQPAISPCALVPQELIQPLVPLARLVISDPLGNPPVSTPHSRAVGRGE